MGVLCGGGRWIVADFGEMALISGEIYFFSFVNGWALVESFLIPGHYFIGRDEWDEWDQGGY
jgi:hypothetical protein